MTRRGVFLLALLVMVAVAFLVRDARQGVADKHRRACIENLRDIEGAKEQFAFDHDGIAPENITALIPAYLATAPTCPSGGTYTFGDLQNRVSCSVDDHGMTDR
jgi:hypothetical protein